MTGSIQEVPRRTQQDTEQINGEFQVESATPIVKDCVANAPPSTSGDLREGR